MPFTQDEQKHIDYLHQAVEAILAHLGLTIEASKKDEAIQATQELEDGRELNKQIIEAHKIIADKYEPMLEDAHNAKDEVLYKQLVEQQTAEAKQVEADIIAEKTVLADVLPSEIIK